MPLYPTQYPDIFFNSDTNQYVENTHPSTENPTTSSTPETPGPGDIPLIGPALTEIKNFVGGIAQTTKDTASFASDAKDLLNKLGSKLFDVNFWKSTGIIIGGVLIAGIGLIMWGMSGTNKTTINIPKSMQGETVEAGEAGEAGEAAAVA